MTPLSCPDASGCSHPAWERHSPLDVHPEAEPQPRCKSYGKHIYHQRGSGICLPTVEKDLDARGLGDGAH